MEANSGTKEETVGVRVLVTGSCGMIGRGVIHQLGAAGFDVVGLDIADGNDVNDPDIVDRLFHGCSFVVHTAALDDELDEPHPLAKMLTGNCGQVMRTNVAGTSVLLAAAARAGVTRIVFLSSIDILGCFMGQGIPRYLPIDDDYEADPHGPYAWSKLAGEELCAAFTRTTGSATLCLRAPGLIYETNTALCRRCSSA